MFLSAAAFQAQNQLNGLRPKIKAAAFCRGLTVQSNVLARWFKARGAFTDCVSRREEDWKGKTKQLNFNVDDKNSYRVWDTCYLFFLGSCCRLYSPSVWTVYLGKLLLNRNSPTEEVARVQQIHLHQYYDDESHDYDLALLKLDRPAYTALTGHARPACLPPSTHQLEPGLLCWVTGWGALREGGELQGLKALRM